MEPSRTEPKMLLEKLTANFTTVLSAVAVTANLIGLLLTVRITGNGKSILLGSEASFTTSTIMVISSVVMSRSELSTVAAILLGSVLCDQGQSYYLFRTFATQYPLLNIDTPHSILCCFCEV